MIDLSSFASDYFFDKKYFCQKINWKTLDYLVSELLN